MHRTRTRAGAAALGLTSLAVLAAQTARAQTTYSSPAALTAAISSPETITFQTSQTGYYGTPPGFTDPVTDAHFDAIGTTDSLFVVAPSASDPGYEEGLPFLSTQTPTRDNALQITLPRPVTAFGTDFGVYGANFGPNAAPVTFTFGSLVGGVRTPVAVFTETPPAFPDAAFFGATTTAPFDTVWLTTPDNVRNTTGILFGSAAPEPPQFAAIGVGLLGLLGLGLRARRRTQH